MQDLKYRAHVSNIGWQSEVGDANIAGTVGQNLALEAFQITGYNIQGLGISCKASVQDIGWMNPVIQGEIVGTTGQGKHIEAIQISLWGDEAPNYDIWYRLHVSNYGFLPWVRNGELSGTVGGNIQAEAIQIALVSKNELFWLASDQNVPFMDLTPKVSTDEIINRVLEHANSWVGYLAEENNVFGVANYCIAFICTILNDCGIDFIKTAWCDDAKYWAQERGKWIGDPAAGQRGFPIAFDFEPKNGVTNHFGIVESVRDDGGYNTIEANTSGANGIGIYRKVRYIEEDGIEGFINPY